MHMEIVEYEYVVSRHAKNTARDGSILTDVYVYVYLYFITYFESSVAKVRWSGR